MNYKKLTLIISEDNITLGTTLRRGHIQHQASGIHTQALAPQIYVTDINFYYSFNYKKFPRSWSQHSQTYIGRNNVSFLPHIVN